MKKLFPFICLVLTVVTTASYAQSAKAPVRKPASKTSQSGRTTSAPANTIVKPTGSAGPASPAPAPRPNSPVIPGRTTPAVQPAAKPVTTVPTRRTNIGRTRVKSVSSEGYGYKKNDKLLNIGVGLSSYYYGNPIGLSYEVGVTDDISVGGQLDYNSGRYDDYYGYSYRYRYSAYYLGARGSYHFGRILRINSQKMDLYAGLGIGYQSFKWNDNYYGSGYGYNYGSGLFLNYFIGGKYYFTNKVGAFLELGYTGLSTSRIGLAVKF